MPDDNIKPDQETQKILTEGEHLLNLVKGEGWQIARKRLFGAMDDVDSIQNIDDLESKDNAKIVAEMLARKIAIDLVKGWFDEIDGLVQSHVQQIRTSRIDEDQDGYIKRFE